jgi:hypothetical protein
VDSGPFDRMTDKPGRVFAEATDYESLLGALALKLVVVEDKEMMRRISPRIRRRYRTAGQRRSPRTRAIAT